MTKSFIFINYIKIEIKYIVIMNLNNDPDNKISEEAKKILESHLREKEKLIFENNNFTSWFKEMIIDEDLLEYFENSLPELTNYLYKRMIRDCIRYECKQDIQNLYIDYLAPISPDDVDYKERTERRTEQISKWGSYHSLNRIYFDYNNDKALDISRLPVVMRKYDLERKNKKFTLGDGNHRFFFTKKKSIPTVMCLVHDHYIIRKSWVDKNIGRLKKEKEEHLSRREGTLIL